MITIEIDDKPIEDIIKEKDNQIYGLEGRIKILEDESIKTTSKVAKYKDDLKELHKQLIDIKTEEIKERKSLWEFLTGWAKAIPTESPEKPFKSSRLTESTVSLGK